MTTYATMGITTASGSETQSKISGTAGQVFVAGSAALPAFTSNITVQSTGEVQMPSQPCFMGILQTSDSDVTGDGTTYYLGSGNALTFTINQGSYCSTAGVFTVPRTGNYYLTFSCKMSGILVGHTLLQTFFYINAPYTVLLSESAPFTLLSSGGYYMLTCSTLMKLNAAQTVQAGIVASGGTKVIDIYGTNASQVTSFGGWLVN